MPDAQPQAPDIAGALAAGYTPSQLLAAKVAPTDILNALAAQKGAPDIAGARSAGYSDDDIIQGLTAPVSSQAPAAAPGPAPDGSLLNAAEQSLLHGAPAAIASGLSGFGRFANRIAGTEDTGHVSDQLDAYAARQSAAQAQNYQAPAGSPTSVVDAVSGSSGPLDAAGRVASFGVRKAAENVGTLLPNLALGIAAPETTAVRVGLPLYDYLSNLGGVRSAKAAAGADPNNVTLGDVTNAAGQTALMAASPLGAGGNLITRPLGAIVDGASKGAVQSVANDLGGVLQGGQSYGTDPISLAGALGSHALDAGVAGATTAAGLGFAKAGAQAVANARVTGKAGPDMQAYAAEVAPWQAALASATQRVQAANPDMDPEAVKAQAYQAAQQGTPQQPGVAPPSFSSLSPAAQNGLAQKSTLEMLDAARQAMTVGMGKPNADPPNAQVAHFALSTMADQMGQFAQAAKASGIMTPDQVGVIQRLVTAAKQHNTTLGANGEESGFYPTLLDQVSTMPIDPTMKDQVLHTAKVMDILSQARLLKNNQGPLEANAKMIMGLGGGALGALAGDPTGHLGAIFGETAGKLAGQSLAGASVQTLRALDNLMGWGGKPEVMRNADAVNAFADRNGLSGSVLNPEGLIQVTNELRGLSQTAPLGPQLAAQAAAAQAASKAPFTTSGRGYEPPMPQAAPVGPATSPPPPGSPQGPVSAPVVPGPVAAPATSAMAPIGPAPAPLGRALPGAARAPAVAPITAADRLAMAPRSPAPAPVQAVGQAPATAQAPAQALPGLTGAMQSITSALEARNGRLAQAAQAAFPSDRRGWSAAMAQQLGVEHGPLMAAIQSTASSSPELQATLAGHTLPIELLRTITNHAADLRDQGKLPLVGQAGPTPSPASPIRNPLSYAANLAQEASTAEGIKAANPGLAHVVDAMRDPSQNGKTAEGRAKAMETYLAGLPPGQRASVEAILRPLAGFGQRQRQAG